MTIQAAELLSYQKGRGWQIAPGVSQKELSLWCVQEHLRCRADPWYFATRYCITCGRDDATLVPIEARFPAWGYLRDLIFVPAQASTEGGPTHLSYEKSRQMLVSWSWMAIFLHDITFRSNWTDLAMSRRENEVDDGGDNSSWTSLLGKVRFMWRHLPEFLKTPLHFKLRRVSNSLKNSYIVGETANPDAGRGGTWNRALLDEAAFIPASRNVLAATTPSAASMIIVSTPNGRANVLADIKFGEDGDYSGYEMYTIHWSLRPDRDEAWYEAKARQMSRDLIARELDIDYSDSRIGKVFPEFTRDVHVVPTGYDPSWLVYRTWDFGMGDPTIILWIQAPKDLSRHRIIDAYRNNNQPAQHYADYCSTKRYRQVMMDFGDPAGGQRDSEGRSWIARLGALGIRIRCRAGVSQDGSVELVKLALQHGALEISASCPSFVVDAMENHTWETTPTGLIKSGAKLKHDIFHHPCSALRYYFANIAGMRSLDYLKRAATPAMAHRATGYGGRAFQGWLKQRQPIAGLRTG